MGRNHTVQKASALLLNSCKPGKVHKYIFKMFQPFIFVLAVLQKQLSPGVILREKMFQIKTICISLNFESCLMPKHCVDLLIPNYLWQMKTSCTGALQGVLHFCRQTCGSYRDKGSISCCAHFVNHLKTVISHSSFLYKSKYNLPSY